MQIVVWFSLHKIIARKMAICRVLYSENCFVYSKPAVSLIMSFNGNLLLSFGQIIPGRVSMHPTSGTNVPGINSIDTSVLPYVNKF